jgi:hypothetical protein
MADDMHARAANNLAVISDYFDALANATKEQLDDTKEVVEAALKPDTYSTERLIADTTALWINAMAIPFRAMLTLTPDDDDDT